MSHTPGDLEEAYERFCARWATGERPDVETYCQSFDGDTAKLAVRIREFVEILSAVREEACDRRPQSRPERFGDYHILGEIGRGGMGTVYRARDNASNRVVALKLPSPELLLRPESRERFRRETRATAQLRHPGIVTVHAVGEVDGAPFMAMDLVEGVPLHDVLDELAETEPRAATGASLYRALARAGHDRFDPPLDATAPVAFAGPHVEVVARITLQVAEALAAAHAAGIVHRDVKPSNILLRRDGSTVLTDFGVARLEGTTALTQTGEYPGTPEYMAPERVRRIDGHDARVDVYSLGVTLFELLTFEPPFRGEHSAAIWHAVLNAEPPLHRREYAWIPRDLATICSTAMETAPGRRYRTGTDMAADLRRFLAYEPIEARPVGPITRARRWAARRPARAAAWALAVLVVTVGPSVWGWKEFETRRRVSDALREREVALTDAAREVEALREVSRLVVDIFRVPETAIEIGSTLTAAELLARGADTYRRRLADRPDLRGRLFGVLGDVHLKLGLFSRAEQLLAEAAADLEGVHGPSHPSTLDAHQSLALARALNGQMEDAIAGSRRVLAVRTETFGAEDPATLATLSNLGEALRRAGRFDDAATSLERAVAGQLAVLGPRHPDAVVTRNRLALLELERGRFRVAEGLFRELDDDLRDSKWHSDEERLRIRSNLAIAYERQGRDDEAARLHDEVLTGLRNELGPHHPVTLSAWNNLAQLQDRTGRNEVAEAGYRGAWSGAVERLGPDHPLTLTIEYNVGALLVRLARFAEARTIFERNLEARRRVLGEDHPDTISSYLGWSRILIWLGREAEGEALMRKVIAARTQILGPDHLRTLHVRSVLAGYINHEGRTAEAEALWLDILATTTESLGSQHFTAVGAMRGLLQLYLRQDRLEEALPLAERLAAVAPPPGVATTPAAEHLKRIRDALADR